MTWRKTAATAMLALVVVLCMTGCPNKPPATPGAPWGADSTWTYSTYTCSVVTTTSKGFIRYIMDWQDAIDTGDVAYASKETAAVTHEWDSVGVYAVKAQAIRDDDPKKFSDFSPPKSVRVILNQRPVVDSIYFPPYAVKGAPTNITVYGHDDDGDSLRAIAKWSGGDTTTDLTSTPGVFPVTCIFDDVGTARVIVWVQDWKKAKSIPDTIFIPVGLEGGVRWLWRGAEDGPMTTSALVANDGSDEVVMSYCEDDQTFRAITAAKGKSKREASTRHPYNDFSGGPALSATTGHVIVGSSEGELYALTLADLSRAWRWPDVTPEDSEPFNEFGAPAINGSDFYVGRDVAADTSFGMLYKFTDLGTSVTMVASYMIGKNEAAVDAPAVDGTDGSVYFSTEAGYLIKIDKDLASPLWKRQLVPNADLGGPIIGNDRTVYCAVSDTPAIVFAINPDSTTKWTLTLDAPGPRLALGQNALFVGTDLGTAYSINPGTGTINWQKSFSGGVGFNTTPIVAANGYVYFQTDDDVLYCLNQADGTQIWACDCNYYLPQDRHGAGSRRPRVAGLTDYDANPSITNTGDIIVVGKGALFCVAGYAAGTLDASAAWPKWQKDLSNTGKK